MHKINTSIIRDMKYERTVTAFSQAIILIVITDAHSVTWETVTSDHEHSIHHPWDHILDQ